MHRLEGLRLLLTRSAEDSKTWAELLQAEGAVTVILPCISSEISDDPMLGAQITTALADADWLVFTSQRGVAAVAALAGDAVPAGLKIAVVGQTTADCARSEFGRVDMIGRGTGAVLGQAMAKVVRPGTRCVLAVAANAGNELESILTQAGAKVSRFDAYRTIPVAALNSKRALSEFGVDTVIFASPSAVTGFANQVSIDMPVRIVTIGPTTTAAVRRQGWQVASEAGEPGLPGIIHSLTETADA